MAKDLSRKHFELNSAKIRRSQKARGTKPEPNELASDSAIAEDAKNRLVVEATIRFLKSGIVIKDVYGKLDG